MATIKKIGTIRVRTNQIEMIVEAMEQNPLLNVNKVTSTYTAAKRNEDWGKLSKKLNSSGGAIKSVRCWQKCWSDKKTEVKKRSGILKTGNLKSGRERNEEKKLTPLEERIVLLIRPDAAEGLDVEECESMPKELVIPKVEDCPPSPASGSSYVKTTLLSNSQPFTQESNQSNSEEHLPDIPSCLPDIEEPHQPESLPPLTPQLKTPQVRLRSLARRVRTKPVVLKSDNAQKLVEGQTEMAAALTRCAEALEKHIEIQERALEIEKRKADAQERALEIKKRKADAFVEILSVLKNKF
ncbi:hypothetical protein AVEN_9998-1 [Araneus ventricosus]|uniref:Regulatory protein zeste n=1 Tax=Araneus ventricosus TaxID=182803 RepID=A0A4Y2LDK2_ARAVE|nr:hypothetical protein AVEN_9998-1 [Araneus ventricosus]